MSARFRSLSAGAAASRAPSWQVEGGRESSVRWHRDNLAALRSRDPDRARLAMKVHLDDVEGHIRKVLERCDSAAP
jgi:DNA-binding GntR family transcriptional regulator